MSTVAIIGRANVGKSTLFNKLCGQRLSIECDIKGTTRDRVSSNVSWLDKNFTLIDTGGLEEEDERGFQGFIKEQADFAISISDAIIMVVNLKDGVTATDLEIASMLRKCNKPVVVAVNKCDSIGELPLEFYDFYELGFDTLIAISSIHGHGTGDLLDEVVAKLSDCSEEIIEDGEIKVAIIGKPNVGKSSLLNKILGVNRSIVSDIEGTTRDSIDEKVINEHGIFRFIDTAGIRKAVNVRKSHDVIEHYSILRTELAIKRADVVLIMIDAIKGFTEQDAKIAGLAVEEGKGIIIVVNKWDAIKKDTNTMKEYIDDISRGLSFISYANMIFISALTGQRVDTLYSEIIKVASNNCFRISTGLLNEVVGEACLRVAPPTDKGKRLKIYYATQASVKPPTFIFFCNEKELFHFSYQRYIENRLRDSFSLVGTPIRFVIKEKGE